MLGARDVVISPTAQVNAPAMVTMRQSKRSTSFAANGANSPPPATAIEPTIAKYGETEGKDKTRS